VFALVLAAVVLVARAEEKQAAPLSARLKQPVDFKGIDADPKMTLEEALDLLAKEYGLKFDVNEAAFKGEQAEDVLSKPVVEQSIRKMSHVPLAAVLRKVLARVPSESGATYILRDGTVEITTHASVIKEIWGDAYSGPYLPLVNATVDKRPLEDALKELAAATEYNIVLDSRSAEKAKIPVSATFANTPLDTAVRLLADMADLKPFLVDNVIYVTTRERAKQMEEQDKPKTPTLVGTAGGLGAVGGLGALGALGGGGIGGFGGMAPGGPRIGRGRWGLQPASGPANGGGM
jgi:hypothetical protein